MLISKRSERALEHFNWDKNQRGFEPPLAKEIFRNLQKDMQTHQNFQKHGSINSKTMQNIKKKSVRIYTTSEELSVFDLIEQNLKRRTI
jgi:hypothetical protein